MFRDLCPQVCLHTSQSGCLIRFAWSLDKCVYVRVNIFVCVCVCLGLEMYLGVLADALRCWGETWQYLSAPSTVRRLSNEASYKHTHEQKRTRKNVYKMQLSIFVLILPSFWAYFNVLFYLQTCINGPYIHDWNRRRKTWRRITLSWLNLPLKIGEHSE